MCKSPNPSSMAARRSTSCPSTRLTTSQCRMISFSPPGSTTPIGRVRLPVTFGQRDNYRTELIDFDVGHIRLPYNAILGYPSLAKFMAVTHHGYNVLKMPGSGGVITVPCEEKDAVCSWSEPFRPRH